MLTAEAFLSDVEAYLKQAGMSATAFGHAALKDPNFVHDLRQGRKPNLGIVERVYIFMNENGDAAQGAEDAA